MAGTASIEYETISRGTYSGKSIQRIKWTLTGSIAGGSVDAAATDLVSGRLSRVSFHPSRNPRPDDAWDVYLWDDTAEVSKAYGSIDLLASAGENRSDLNATQVVSSSPPLVAGKIHLVTRNMGINGKKAKVIAYLE